MQGGRQGLVGPRRRGRPRMTQNSRQSLKRTTAFAEMAALHKALKTGFKVSLEKAKCQKECIIRPLKPGEERGALSPGSEY